MIIAVGVAATLWIVWLGVPLIVVGLIYVFLVIRRALQWRWLRNKAGLN